MLIIENTPQLAGITIKGDYQDLKSLHRAISNYSEFYFPHQDNVNAGNCHECLLGLCYDLRHAFQGDRNFESMENNADRIAGMVGIITEPARGEMELIKAARAAYGNGNLYFSVEVLYPWALYYTQVLHSITDVAYSKAWFEDLDFPYDEYQAEKDAASIHQFVLLIWEAIRNVLPPQDVKCIYDYCRMFAKEDYYMSYPDMYLEWLCSWWVSALCNREDRQSMLSLLCLELSSVNEEDELEIQDELDEIQDELNKIQEKLDKKQEELKETRHESEEGSETKKGEQEEANNSRSSIQDKNFLLFNKELHELTLSCLQMYDGYMAEADLKCLIPFQSMDEYMDEIHEYVKTHGQFYRDSYDEYIERIFGSIDWDRLEW